MKGNRYRKQFRKLQITEPINLALEEVLKAHEFLESGKEPGKRFANPINSKSIRILDAF